MEPTIVCPSCKSEIKLTESLAAPLIEATKKQYEDRLVESQKELETREAAISVERQKVEQGKLEIDKTVAERVAAERSIVAQEEAAKARQLAEAELRERDDQLASLNEVLQQRDKKLTEAQQAQAELLKKERALEDEKRELELTVQRRVSDEIAVAREKAKREAEEGLQLKVREKEEQIASMQRQIEDLKRKAEQGSQQLQGEVIELELEEILRARFPRDEVEPVPKGEFGGDLLHRVFTPGGQHCGTILWETKRTRNWSDGWLSKLRGDQRAAKADVALIVSQALPKDMDASFDLVEGVWVTEPKCAVPVAIALRESLLALASARQAGEGQQTKMELVYQYLIGPRFRHRVEAIVEKFTDMQGDLDRERKMMTRMWAKRDEQIRLVIESTAGMYGDLQGIAGRSLGEIEGLDLQLLEGPEVEDD